MFLAIDIGNSNIVFGVFNNNGWEKIFRVSTHNKIELPTDLIEKYIPHVKKSAMSSVVPSVTASVIAVLEILKIRPCQIDKSCFQYLNIQINNESEIGMDLVANAVESHSRFPDDGKIIIDFGTALTFTTISKTGQILGVAIAPGIKTAMYSLFENAEQLPDVPLKLPESVLGQNTTHALQSGVLFGYVGLVEGMLKRIQMELEMNCKVLATGGLSSLMIPLHQSFDVLDVNLTLSGIKKIYQQAKSGT